MSNIFVPLIEFLSNYKNANFMLILTLIVFVLISLMTIAVSFGIIFKLEIGTTKERNTFLSVGLISSIISFILISMLSPYTVPKDTCYVKNINNRYKIDKKTLPRLEKWVKEYNEDISLGIKFGTTNVNNLIESRDF